MDQSDPSRIGELLSGSRSLRFSQAEDSAHVGRLAAQLARALLVRAHELETAQERQARSRLGRVLGSRQSQAFSVALTDRIHRTEDAALVVSTTKELLSRADPSFDLPPFDRLQLQAARRLGAWLPELTHLALRHRVDREARPFLLHADEPRLTQQLQSRRGRLGAVNLNYLGEEVLSERDAQERRKTYQALATRTDIDALSLKLSGIDAQLEPLCVDDDVARLYGHVSQILEVTQTNPQPPLVYFDMEAYRDLELAERLVERLLDADPTAHGWSPALQLGVAVQAYLPEALGLIERLALRSKARVERGFKPLRIRLVKGANLLTERVEASVRGIASPIFATKLETDAHYKRCLRRLAEHAREGALVAGVASHNLFDIAYALLLREHFGVSAELQVEMLEGMAGAMGRAVAQAAGSLLVYSPAVRDEHFTSAVSYLVRRLDENTVPGHFLHDAAQMEVGDAAFERQERAFLASLEESWITPPRTLRAQDRRAPTQGRAKRRHEFNNTDDTDWTRSSNRQWLEEHLHEAKRNVQVRPILHPSILEHGTLPSLGFDPSQPTFTYPVELASEQHVAAAITAAHDYRDSWARVPLSERVTLLRNIADQLEAARGALLAAMVLDAGKRPIEADVEVSEAIDFAHYYAHRAEVQRLRGVARGVTVVTPPWNFPLAIPLSGVLAALVSGNPVILKPAPETPWVTWLATQLCHAAGVPRAALQFLPCRDEDASALIEDSRVATVVLTGATATARLFLQKRPTLHLLAETGGKNAAYVSNMSDREQAIAHVLKSAFGHSGQKCSALSVLILHHELFDDETFKAGLVEATRTLTIGSAWEGRSHLTPLIRPPEGALATILQQGERQGTWALRPSVHEDNPRLLGPGILWGVREGSFAQQTEFFGPILSVLRAEDFAHALRILNSTSYGLTAGLFSLRETEQEAFVSQAEAGNLYINRPITGAVVGRQPFGGRKQSGFGPGAKAGGPDYLLQFVRPPQISSSKTAWNEVSANYRTTMREHFALVHSGTPVLGEHNFLRYQTASTLLVLGDDVDEMSLAASLLARHLTGNQLPICGVGAPSKARLEMLLTQAQQLAHVSLRQPLRAVTQQELWSLIAAHRVERVRTLGHVPSWLQADAARVPLTVISDPVSADGAWELMYYLFGQSISHAYHRHGNLKLEAISHLRRHLEQANRHFPI